MDISLIKQVLLLVSPTIIIVIIAFNIHHHLVFGHDVLLWRLIFNLSPESFRNEIQLEFNIWIWKTALWGGGETFLDLVVLEGTGHNLKTKPQYIEASATLLEKWHPIGGRYLELEDNGKPVGLDDVHLLWSDMFSIIWMRLPPKSTAQLNGVFLGLFIAWIWSNVVHNSHLHHTTTEGKDQQTMTMTNENYRKLFIFFLLIIFRTNT